MQIKIFMSFAYHASFSVGESNVLYLNTKVTWLKVSDLLVPWGAAMKLEVRILLSLSVSYYNTLASAGREYTKFELSTFLLSEGCFNYVILNNHRL